MRYAFLLGWGVAIYAVMFLLWSGFVLYGFAEGILPRIAGLLALVSLALIAGHSLRFSNWRDILPYSVAWTIIVGLLDIVFSVPFTGWALFSDWNVWVGYMLVLSVPLLAPFTQRIHHAPDATPHET